MSTHATIAIERNNGTRTAIYLHFDGCGTSTLLNILKYCGLTRQEWNETKTSDFIYCERD